MKRITIFASGTGSNAEQIARYFADRADVEITLMLTNNPNAGVIERARRLHIPVLLFDRTAFYQTSRIIDCLLALRVDLVVLAGFMWLLPGDLVQAFAGRIVNIHPALLPKFGGKGMYGHHVHEAVVKAGEPESGITVHWVNEQYDEGAVIFQATCPVLPTDTPDDVAHRVQTLEHEHYPVIIDKLLQKL